jgi:hypothetical protein
LNALARNHPGPPETRLQIFVVLSLARSPAADVHAFLGHRTFHHQNDDEQRKHRNGG